LCADAQIKKTHTNPFIGVERVKTNKSTARPEKIIIHDDERNWKSIREERCTDEKAPTTTTKQTKSNHVSEKQQKKKWEGLKPHFTTSHQKSPSRLEFRRQVNETGSAKIPHTPITTTTQR
jgi:regulatory protein YycH of two-component signal transduction system YycFG